MSFINKLNNVIKTNDTVKESIEKWLLIKMKNVKLTSDGCGYYIIISNLYKDPDFPKDINRDMEYVISIINDISPFIAGLIKWSEGSGMEYGNGQYEMIIYYYPNASESKIKELNIIKNNL